MNEGFPVRKSVVVEEKEEELKIQKKDGMFGFNFLSFNTDVIIGKDGVITFTKDIDFNDLPSFMSESAAGKLFDAGVLKKGNPDGCKSKYQLGGDGRDGWIILDKGDLNDAIKDGRLKVGLNEEGDIEVL